MTRIKGGLLHSKRRRGILKHTKGFKWGRKSKIKVAKVAKMKAGQHAFASRRTKKRLNRGLWQVRINAGSRKLGISYSKLMGQLTKKGVLLNRKMLAELSAKYPGILAKIAELTA